MTEPIDTYQAMEQAIATHFSTMTDGAYLNHWVLQMAGSDLSDDKNTTTLIEIPPNQPWYITFGLVRLLHNLTKHEQFVSREDLEDED